MIILAIIVLWILYGLWTNEFTIYCAGGDCKIDSYKIRCFPWITEQRIEQETKALKKANGNGAYIRFIESKFLDIRIKRCTY